MSKILFAVATDDAALTAALTATRARCQRFGLDDDQTCDALANCWREYTTRGAYRDADFHAFCAVRSAFCGRPLRGMGWGRRGARLVTLRDAVPIPEGMQDPAPGPLQRASDREAWLIWESQLTARERHLLACLLDGCNEQQTADTLGISRKTEYLDRMSMVAKLAD